MDKYILVGKTNKTHGIKGGVKLYIEEKYIEDVLRVDTAFLKIQGKLLPYFILEFDYTNNLIVRFEDINSPQDAVEVTSKEFYIRQKDIREKDQVTPENSLQFGYLKGFSISEAETGPIGEILEIMEFPQQEMARIEYQNKEILIPLNEKLIQTIDEKAQIIYMNLPEGLLEL